MLVVLAKVNLNTASTVDWPSARYRRQTQPTTRKRITTKLRQQIVEHYEQGNVSALQAAEEFGISKTSVLNILKREGAAVRKHGHRL